MRCSDVDLLSDICPASCPLFTQACISEEMRRINHRYAFLLLLRKCKESREVGNQTFDNSLVDRGIGEVEEANVDQRMAEVLDKCRLG